MNDLKIIDVFAVYGDSSNIGRGVLIGVFEEEKHAKIAVEGRGCLDSSVLPYKRPSGERGNGTIEKKKAIKINDEIYLLELNHLIKLNTELTINKRVSTCVWEEEKPYFRVKLIYVNPKKAIEFMKFVRSKTEMSLVEVKDVYDKFKEKGSAIIEPFNYNLNSEISKEEFIEWRQELELRDIAKIEAA